MALPDSTYAPRATQQHAAARLCSPATERSENQNQRAAASLRSLRKVAPHADGPPASQPARKHRCDRPVSRAMRNRAHPDADCSDGVTEALPQTHLTATHNARCDSSQIGGFLRKRSAHLSATAGQILPHEFAARRPTACSFDVARRSMRTQKPHRDRSHAAARSKRRARPPAAHLHEPASMSPRSRQSRKPMRCSTVYSTSARAPPALHLSRISPALA